MIGGQAIPLMGVGLSFRGRTRLLTILAIAKNPFRALLGSSRLGSAVFTSTIGWRVPQLSQNRIASSSSLPQFSHTLMIPHPKCKSVELEIPILLVLKDRGVCHVPEDQEPCEEQYGSSVVMIDDCCNLSNVDIHKNYRRLTD